MPLDSNIIMGFRPTVELQNPQDVQAKALGLRAANQQAQMQDQQFADSQAERQAFKQNLNPDGTINREGVIKALNESGQAKKAADYSHVWNGQDVEKFKQQHEVVEKIWAGINDENTYQAGRAQLAKIFPEKAAQMPANFDQKFVETARRGVMSVGDQFGLHYKDQQMKMEQERLDLERGKAAQSKQGQGGDLRQEFNTLPVVKDMQSVSVAYNKLRNAAKDPSAAGDMSMIYSVNKMLDPGSTVREGEFANAQNAAGWSEQARTAYNRALNGERLSQAQREDFLGQGKKLYQGQKSMYDKVKTQYGGFAQKRGLNPSEIFADFSADEDAPTGGNPNQTSMSAPGSSGSKPSWAK